MSTSNRKKIRCFFRHFSRQICHYIQRIISVKASVLSSQDTTYNEKKMDEWEAVFIQQKRRFMMQGLLLSGVSLLLRSVGVLSQMIIASRVGAEALGVSSLIGGVGGFAVTLAMSGIQLGCTRLCAQGLGRRDSVFVHRSLRCSSQ